METRSRLGRPMPPKGGILFFIPIAGLLGRAPILYQIIINTWSTFFRTIPFNLYVCGYTGQYNFPTLVFNDVNRRLKIPNFLSPHRLRLRRTPRVESLQGDISKLSGSSFVYCQECPLRGKCLWQQLFLTPHWPKDAQSKKRAGIGVVGDDVKEQEVTLFWP